MRIHLRRGVRRPPGGVGRSYALGAVTGGRVRDGAGGVDDQTRHRFRETESVMVQIQIKKRPAREPETVDTRTPSGKPLPF